MVERGLLISPDQTLFFPLIFANPHEFSKQFAKISGVFSGLGKPWLVKRGELKNPLADL